MTDRDGRIALARAVALEDELARRGARLRRQGAELVGPCPACGGVDRFSIHRRKQIWHCRKAGRGGDVIDLVQYLDSCSFLDAVERLCGGLGERAPAHAEAAEKARAARDAAENEFRTREIGRARRIWEAAGPLPGSLGEAYLAHRGVTAPRNAKLRFHAACARFEKLGDGPGASVWRRIYEGPALVAAIADNAGRFRGVQVTWIDPRIKSGGMPAGHKGRAEIAHPETGEILESKIVRGSSKGGHIHLGGPEETHDGGPGRLVIGEGTETVLTVHNVELGYAGRDDPGSGPGQAEAGFARTAWWCSVGLQNLGGRALVPVPHPTLKRTDARGRVRAVTVPGPVPLLSDRHPALMPPASATEVLTLGDGDSDRFTALQVHARAAARWAMPGRVIRTAWARDGADFNAMLKAMSPGGAA